MMENEYKEIECKEVIVSKIRRRGSGKEHSPIRAITEVFLKDGTLIAEYDPEPETFVQMDLIHFSRWIQKKGFDPEKVEGRVVNKWLDSIKKG